MNEVRNLFDRFLDWEVCRMAMEHADEEVRKYAVECLRTMAAEGDPFSQALLEDRRVPYPVS